MSALGAPAGAATSPVSATGQATAAVPNTCVVVSADSLVFGAYSPISGLAASGSGQILLRCTKGTSFTVAPSSGISALKGSGGNLQYALYADSAMTQPWGNTTSTKTVNMNTTLSSSDNPGYMGLVFQTNKTLTQAQFLADPSLAAQPYFLWNYNGTLYYKANLVGQYQTSAQETALLNANPGSASALVRPNTVTVSDSPVVPGANATVLVLPSSTARNGSTYTVPSGYSGTGTALTGTATSGLSSKAVTYYGKVPAGQDMTPGVYTDTVIFTVSF